MLHIDTMISIILKRTGFPTVSFCTLKLNATFIPWMPREDVGSLYSRCDEP